MSTIRFHKDEPPDRVHGRLLADVHLTGYTFERACDELKWLLRQDRWKSVSPGFDDVHQFMATIDLKEFKKTLNDRKEIVRQLASIGAGQRATARLLGVSQDTVRHDLGLVERNRSENSTNSEPLQEGIAETPIIGERNRSEHKPYYSEAGITIYHGDCRDILSSLPRGLMVTDPPYNIGYHYNEYADTLEPNEYRGLLNDVLRMPLVFIHYPENLFPVADLFHRAPDKIVAWVYHANTPKQWRAVAWFGMTPDLSLVKQPYKNPDDKRIRELMLRGSQGTDVYDWWHIEQVKNVNPEKTEHPCQIPKAVMMRTLQVTPFAGPVIDPFCGSGTTLLAAQELGRPAIGIDSSEEYCEIAANRLRQRPLSLEVCS